MKGPAQWDLGLELACGCSPQNYCFCGKKDAAKASAYISSCVNQDCGGSQTELTSAIELYDSYCKTANVEVAAVTTSSPAGAQTSATKAADQSIPANTAGSATRQVGATSDPTLDSSSKETTAVSPSSATAEEGKKKGLSQSDIIAMAVGLGVGVPSLLLALGTFCLARRNSKRSKEVDNTSPAQSSRQY